MWKKKKKKKKKFTQEELLPSKTIQKLQNIYKTCY